MQDDSNDLFANMPSQPAAPPVEKPVAAAAPTREARPAPPSEGTGGYDASAIRVLEGLEPVRMRPGMYIGGTDEKALHHLFAEVIDNSMDEAVAGHANFIEVNLDAEGFLTVTDNGRGIPVENHPQMPGKSTLEVILTVLHAGGKFDGKAYETSGGLHGVGVSVVNALSDLLEVEVARNKKLYRQRFSRGKPLGPLEELGDVHNRRGTKVRFHPDPEIFGAHAHFDPGRVFRMARSKAYLFGGVEIRWSCDPALLPEGSETPEKAVFHFPGGLKDYLQATLGKEHTVTREIFAGKSEKSGGHGSLEWAVTWYGGDSLIHSYCNTIPTADGGTHEAGLRIALTKGLKNYAELTQNKRAAAITTDDVMISAVGMLSVFIREPEFVGQTKDKLATVEAQRIVENALRDPFDHYLADNPGEAAKLLDWVIERAEERLRRRKEKEVSRKTAVRKLRLPGKLADCAQNSAEGAELFIVEGDSAGGSAKQARNRANQAILPLRGKILNVASAGREKLGANQQISDLVQALGCGTRSKYREDDLRYERVIVMTDADVDGAHIASLLITFFYQEMPDLIRGGHLYLAVPPLYRISQGGKTLYARDDPHREELMRTEFNGRGKVEIGRFKGLGEMLPAQLKETTMDPKKRTLLKVAIDDVDFEGTRTAVDDLMGTKPEARFRFIQERAVFADNLDI
ncbi:MULTISPECIES: DNA topoisomerase IV subunit B [unclassified Shinella]|uniref:DNA topoisomerase IV subunit B n=1 Tax=unclassified Shinella TaxID=2643062 RepID=UPI00225D8A9E|nr:MULTISPECIES: DNA topoisomerase IV subunit B [unclassified Shinella]MCO5138238.1 DNA topoisomerase IV subunit B [Shinella sp.]MDC7255074.1 DNA topoisomerase IV subunit B [Shinella sp. YE25]CAI0337831.1 DNA topoisomerase 4 subunit B [Rhizobiaceae bacterium]CAK7256305.1 DNA topoisomerase 4 subunit B [Shinella sp. WSC3-e]